MDIYTVKDKYKLPYKYNMFEETHIADQAVGVHTTKTVVLSI